MPQQSRAIKHRLLIELNSLAKKYDPDRQHKN